MAQKSSEMHAINRIAKILEEIPLTDRTYVLTFLRGISDEASAKVPARIRAALEGLDPTACVRVMRLFVDQVAEAYAREHGDGEKSKTVGVDA